eukprot:1159662-Pelagomonas_calceolata.AAC.7
MQQASKHASSHTSWFRYLAVDRALGRCCCKDHTWYLRLSVPERDNTGFTKPVGWLDENMP